MKKIRFLQLVFTSIATGILLSACADVEIPGSDKLNSYTKVYMPQAVTIPCECSLALTDSIYSFAFGAAVGGFNAHEGEIRITFFVDTSLLSTYNLTNGTNYLPLPSSCYTLSDTIASIPSNKLNSIPLKMMVSPLNYLQIDKEYLLAISIKNITGNVPINESLRTAYFHFIVKPIPK